VFHCESETTLFGLPKEDDIRFVMPGADLCWSLRKYIIEGHGGETIMYSMWKIRCFFFFYLKPHEHISSHQIHKIIFFLAASYDPFNTLATPQDTMATTVPATIVTLQTSS